MTPKELKKELLKDPEFKEEYNNHNDMYFEIGELFDEFRLKFGLTKKELRKFLKQYFDFEEKQEDKIKELEGRKKCSISEALTILAVKINEIVKALNNLNIKER